MVDWFYGQIVGFLGNFFALMGNMGVELFELEWVSAIILFFSRLAWALFTVSVVVCAFECGIEYSAGRGNLQQCGMNIIKGFLAVSLFTVVPVRLYALSVSLQGTFSAGLTGYGRSIGEVGQDIITELSEIQTLSDVINSSHFGLGIITSPIIPVHQFIFNGGNVDKKFFMDNLQLEESEYALIRDPQRGSCLYKCGNERYLLQVQAPEYKQALFGTAGGR